jgi:filamentous hemagglutinin
MTLTAAQIQSAGGAQLQAGGSVNLSAATTGESMRFGSTGEATFHQNLASSTQTGATISTGGNLTVVANGDITGVAANLSAGGTLGVGAGGNISFTEGRTTKSEDLMYVTQQRDLVSSSETTHTSTSSSSMAIGGALSGTKGVVLQGGGLVQLSAQNVTSTGGNVSISGAEVVLTSSLNSNNSNVSSVTTGQTMGTSKGSERGTETANSSLAQMSITGQNIQITSADQLILGAVNMTATGSGQPVQSTLNNDLAFANRAEVSAGAKSEQSAAMRESAMTGKATEVQLNTTPFDKLQEGLASRTGLDAGMREQLAKPLAEPNLPVATAPSASSTGGTINLNAKSINFASVTTTDYTSTYSKDKNLVWQSSSGSGTYNQGTAYNQLNGNVKVQAATVTVDMSVKDSAAALASQPGMAWIGQLANDPNLAGKVNWKAVEEAHKNWNYSQEGLSPAGAAILSLAVAFASGVDISKFAVGLVGEGATAAALTAGMTSLASQAAVGLVNNGGDIGKILQQLGSSESLKGLALSMVTAGALNGLNNYLPDYLQNTNAKSPFTDQLTKNLINNAAAASVRSALTGASLEDGLKQSVVDALITTGAAQGANFIGDMASKGKIDEFGRAVAHAIAGCVAGAAKAQSGDGCSAGAVGAVVGELAAQFYNDGTGAAPKIDTVQFAALMSGVAGAIVGGDAKSVSLAASTGANAAANNYLNHASAMRLSALRGQANCDTNCKTEIKTLETLDTANNKALAACEGVSGSTCDGVRQEVRTAAAEYIRKNTTGTGADLQNTYSSEKTETLALAQGTMSGVTKGQVTGFVTTVADGVQSIGTGMYLAGKALLGDTTAQQLVKDGSGAAWDYVKDPNNWPYLVGAMTPADREKLAQAYETGNGKVVGEIMGASVANLPIGGGGMGTIKKFGNVADAAGDAAKLAAKVDGVGVPMGTRTSIPSLADEATRRSLIRKNDSADILAKNGFKVEQNPLVTGTNSKPDYRINGEIFDNYAPSTSSVRNIASEIEGKILKGQTENVVVNLADSSVTPVALQAQLQTYSIQGLKQVVVIDKNNAVTILKLKGN